MKIKGVLYFILLHIVFLIFISPLIIFYGPFNNVKSTVVGMSINSSKFHFFPELFLSDHEIEKILKDNSAVDPTLSNSVKTLKFGIKNNRIDVYNIKGSGFSGKIMIISDPRSIKIGLSALLPKAGETTSAISKSYNAIASINAGGFSDNGWNATGGAPIGFIIKNGKIVYSSVKSNKVKLDTAAFTEDGMLIVGKHTIEELIKYKVKEAVSFGPPLIVNGKATISRGDGGWGIAPRTAIGQRDDGEVIFLVIDGRNLNSLGATLRQEQDILLKYGAVNAVNLDGGSSSTMYFQGKIINTPADLLGERAVPTVFMVVP